ncbi:hypothetical protein MSG28_004117 [Choristoneura fumiferana]|uniref:Uncharacterized protein n=1 Tax=Choristoneura fumiferana TaxID=7141 RepID=A0ACC0KIC6_CHOFU|nr:hypothetical protein MSG28_004117 [Choristoneura fumiferana]
MPLEMLLKYRPSWLELCVRSVYFPRELLRPSSLLTNLVLDETRSSSPRLTATCDHIFAYISDTVAPDAVRVAAISLNWRRIVAVIAILAS